MSFVASAMSMHRQDVAIESDTKFRPAEHAVAQDWKRLHGYLCEHGFALDTLEPRAVLDWDMCTRGDPLFDLATLLSYWTQADDPPAMHDLGQMPTAQEGFPLRNEVVSTYVDLTGRDVSDFLFYRVLAMFKLGVVFLQLHARYRAGVTRDERFAHFGDLGYCILDFTHEIARGRAF